MNSIAWAIAFGAMVLAPRRDSKEPHYKENNIVDTSIALFALIMLFVCTFRGYP